MHNVDAQHKHTKVRHQFAVDNCETRTRARRVVLWEENAAAGYSPFKDQIIKRNLGKDTPRTEYKLQQHGKTKKSGAGLADGLAQV